MRIDPREVGTRSGEVRRGHSGQCARGSSLRSHRVTALLLAAVILVLSACSDPADDDQGSGGPGSDASNTTASGGDPDPSGSVPATGDTGPLLGDNSCDDPEGDVYLASDPTAAPTGRAPSTDLTGAEVEVSGETVRVLFETVGKPSEAEFPELIVFGGGPSDPARFELRAGPSSTGWEVRLVTFEENAPKEAFVEADVSEGDDYLTIELSMDLLPDAEVLSFAFASTALDGKESVNDECFPFAGREPLVDG